MKLRIFGNNLRLRLRRGEVEQLANGQAIEQTAHLLPVSLVYRLEVSAASTATARFDGGTLSVTLPRETARRWAQADEVSIAIEIGGANQERVSLLIEKDFKCLHGTLDDEEDCYPNPQTEIATPAEQA